MADEALKEVLERLLLCLQPPKSGEPRGGALLVALTAEGGTGGPRCVITVAATGTLSQGLDPETLQGAFQGLLQLSGSLRAPFPCCDRILRQARVCLSFELSPPRPLPPPSPRLQGFLHRISLVLPEVEFHCCVRIDSAATSCSYRPEPPGMQAGVRLRVQSLHFVQPAPAAPPPPCARIHPRWGSRIGLGVPAAAAAAGLGGELSVLPGAALCPCFQPTPNLPTRLASAAVFLCDPAGLPLAAPRLLRDPTLWADWERFGFTAGPGIQPEGEGEVVAPDVTFEVQEGPPGGSEHPQTLLLFLLLRHEDPFQLYDLAARRLLAAHLAQVLLGSRPALARGLRALTHPELRGLRHQHRSQRLLARSLPVAVAAVTAVVASSTSARFRQTCLRTMEAEDTPGLAAAAHRSLVTVTHGRRLCRVPCEARGAPRGSPSEQPRRRRRREEEEEETLGSEDGQQEAAGMADWD